MTASLSSPHMIQMISCDSKWSGEGGANCASEFAYEHGLHFVLGPIASPSMRAALPIFHDNKIIT